MARTTPNRPLPPRLTPRAKIWLEVNGQYVFGLGLSNTLKAIAETGSIKAAARRLGKSYRHIWDKVKEAEQALGTALVHTQVGGKDSRRSTLSELGQTLVREFDALRQRMLDLVQDEFRRRLQSP